MSSRQVRLALEKKRQQQETSGSLPGQRQADDSEEESEQVDVIEPAKRRPTAFDLLMMSTEDDEGEGENEEEDEGREGTGEEPVSDFRNNSSNSQSSNNSNSSNNQRGKGGSSKAKGKKRTKGSKQSTSAPASASSVTAKDEREKDKIEDELLMQAQKEFEWMKLGMSDSASASSSSKNHKPVLSVEQRNLKPEVEMRRLFGARTIANADTDQMLENEELIALAVQQQQARNQANRGRRAHVVSGSVKRMNWFVSNKSTWPVTGRGGISMEIDNESKQERLTARELKNQSLNNKKMVASTNSSASASHIYDSETWFKFKHSQTYQQTQLRFLDAVSKYDPRFVADILHAHPFHIDCLLQMSEVMKIHGERNMAMDFIERALFTFESSFHASFNPATGQCRLSFRQEDNRPFFLALFRYAIIVGQRGCWRTALEYCKLLLSLDPEQDPMGVLLMIDFYALRSGEYTWLKRLYEEWDHARNLSLLPNFAFSVALASFHMANSSAIESVDSITENVLLSKATKLLEKAIIYYPQVFKRLVDKCNLNCPSSVLKHPMFDISANQTKSEENLNTLCVLYTERCNSVWKEPEVGPWLVSAALNLTSSFETNSQEAIRAAKIRKSSYPSTPLNIVRHIIVTDLKEVVSTLSSESRPSTYHMYDPLPPPDTTTNYQKLRESHEAESHVQMGALSLLESLYRSLLPRSEDRNQGQNTANLPAGQQRQHQQLADNQGILQMLRQFLLQNNGVVEGGENGLPGLVDMNNENEDDYYSEEEQE